MKTYSYSFILLWLASLPLHADFETWTNKEGQKADLNLVEVLETDGEKVGKFKMRNGKLAVIKHADLSASDRKRIDDWKPEIPGPESVFDDYLWGNLLLLEDEKFVPAKVEQKPEKYYIFYYTASWCGPCQKYTPSLVSWYNENKNENFEIILISSDRSEKAMLKYAESKKMPWPHLSEEKIKAFKSQFRATHGVTGIPSLIVCKPDGTVLGNLRSRLPRLADMVK